MKAAYKYQIAGQRHQIVCNDNQKWYRRSLQLSGRYSPWQAIPAPRITRGCMQVSKKLVKVEKMNFEPFDIPKN